MRRDHTAIGTNSVHSTFLRGGQIFFHNMRMYRQLVMRLLIVCIVITTSIALLLAITVGEQEEMRIFGSWLTAHFWTELGQADRTMSVFDENNEIYHLTAREALTNSYITTHANRFKELLMYYLTVASFVGGAAFVGMFLWFTNHGRRLGSDQHLRGAQVIPAPRLAVEIAAFNKGEARRRKMRKYRPYELVGIPYPFRMETSHTLIMGTTGAGKTQAMVPLLAAIRRRGDRAIIYDKMRSYLPAFYDPSRGDRILNPLDARCSNWSPFCDARSLEDFNQMAAALIPEPTGSADPFWVHSARTVFAVVAHKLYQEGRCTTGALLYKLLRCSHAELASYVSLTIASTAIAPENAKTAQSIRATLVSALASLQAMEKVGDEHDAFSIRQWIKDETHHSFLFLSSRSDKHETLRGLITVWLELALNAIMAQERDPNRTIWIIADELPSLYKLPSLEKGLAEGRQFGAAYVLGIQTLSQLESIYKKEVAHTITGLCRTKLILNLADPDTAETAAKYIGRAEVQRAQRGIGFGASDVRDGVNYTLQDKFDHLVLPEQLMRLPDLTGYLVPAARFATGEVTFPYVKIPDHVPGYIERTDDYEDIDWHSIAPGETTVRTVETPWTATYSEQPARRGAPGVGEVEFGNLAALPVSSDADGGADGDLHSPLDDTGEGVAPEHELEDAAVAAPAPVSEIQPDYDPLADDAVSHDDLASSFTVFTPQEIHPTTHDLDER